jgi:hypothetical protein
MEISSLVNNPSNAQNSYTSNTPKTAADKSQQKATTMASENVDKFDESSVNVNRNFNNRSNRSEFNVQGYGGKSVLQIKNALFADFVNFSVNQQSGNNIFGLTFNPKPFAVDAFNAAEATSSKHEDYWGVEATAERIFTFAKSLAGDNDEMFETMKNAFLKGFNLASKAAGGRLPSISHQTKARVLEMFDEWEAEINARRNPAPAEK